MRPIRVRVTVLRLMLVVGVVAIACSFISGSSKDHAKRCLEIAGNHARVGAEYRRNAKADPFMLRIAAWHDDMRRRFEQAAALPWASPPDSLPFPPRNWKPPEGTAIDNVEKSGRSQRATDSTTNPGSRWA